jgi:hypothetical protein
MKRNILKFHNVQGLQRRYTIDLMGGLGNWMFQIAFSEYLKTKFNIDFRLCSYGKPGLWSTTDLFDNIFRNWKHLDGDRITDVQVTEQKLHPLDMGHVMMMHKDAHITGYFQDYKYITSSFLSKIVLPTTSLERHPEVQYTVFLHIRGGDYVRHHLLDLNLDSYYERAINIFPKDTQFSVFTNDIEYAKSKPFLNTISYTFIQESEVDSLYLMSQCKGGICANSSFSWWGAYLNPDRQITLPSKWFNDPSFYKDGYYFKQATVIQV